MKNYMKYTSFLVFLLSGLARTQTPHEKIVRPSFPLEEIVEVNLSGVQCKGLSLGQRSAWSPLNRRQVSMLKCQKS